MIATKLNKEIESYLESKKYNNFEINIQEFKKNEEVINILLQLNDEQKILINKDTGAPIQEFLVITRFITH